MPISIEDVLNHRPALLIGNGVNRFNNGAHSSWDDLLGMIAIKRGMHLTPEEIGEMSNTERFDILDIARPKDDRTSLQKDFCDPMEKWNFGLHHKRIVQWAKRNETPIITANFDQNLSNAVDAKLLTSPRHTKSGRGFTAFYPWDKYFSDKKILTPRRQFAIWHAHGMIRYQQSIRLGLTHYMGAVERARGWLYKTDESLMKYGKGESKHWLGGHTWLDAFFFSDIAIIGLELGKDETFLRWLFLERARFFKRFPDHRKKTWFIVTGEDRLDARKAFFKHLDMDFVVASTYEQIYSNRAWGEN